MNTFNSVVDLIGKTPVVKLNRITEKYSLKANLFAKLEFMNPWGTAKDRIGYYMIKDALDTGKLKPGGLIIEPTSGNTGIALCAVATVMGFDCIITMPSDMSIERIKLMQSLGAKVVLTPAEYGMQGAIDEAEKIQRENEGSWIAGQFDNPSNPNAHYLTTGPEIWEDMDGNVDVFVATFGTGGTITGCAKYLKEKNPNIKIVGIEPEASPLVTKGVAGSHKIAGIGANFVPSVLNTDLIDEIICVSDDDAFRYAKELSLTEALMGGISSGAALKAAIDIASRDEYEGKNIVFIAVDSSLKYMSTELFS
ncbi:MAG: cysteine synthase A [Anaerofustis stercorihominis]|nr:cysteine synthase A [Anaerofustis stercorihominis]